MKLTISELFSQSTWLVSLQLNYMVHEAALLFFFLAWVSVKRVVAMYSSPFGILWCMACSSYMFPTPMHVPCSKEHQHHVNHPLRTGSHFLENNWSEIPFEILRTGLSSYMLPTSMLLLIQWKLWRTLCPNKCIVLRHKLSNSPPSSNYHYPFSKQKISIMIFLSAGPHFLENKWVGTGKNHRMEWTRHNSFWT